MKDPLMGQEHSFNTKIKDGSIETDETVVFQIDADGDLSLHAGIEGTREDACAVLDGILEELRKARISKDFRKEGFSSVTVSAGMGSRILVSATQEAKRVGYERINVQLKLSSVSKKDRTPSQPVLNAAFHIRKALLEWGGERLTPSQ
ncbi:hypothetical protein HOE67_04135 [Candidatus Peregrinibacteria bacterium]|jgi:hypothetical protein|nr:hypothetical protein [Candidatus Peregrinibacteria bacterium]MBT4056274.1 hypothetical protein [Candidatus Peregrinibacteria bacterium]